VEGAGRRVERGEAHDRIGRSRLNRMQFQLRAVRGGVGIRHLLVLRVDQHHDELVGGVDVSLRVGERHDDQARNLVRAGVEECQTRLDVGLGAHPEEPGALADGEHFAEVVCRRPDVRRGGLQGRVGEQRFLDRPARLVVARRRQADAPVV